MNKKAGNTERLLDAFKDLWPAKGLDGLPSSLSEEASKSPESSFSREKGEEKESVSKSGLGYWRLPRKGSGEFHASCSLVILVPRPLLAEIFSRFSDWELAELSSRVEKELEDKMGPSSTWKNNPANCEAVVSFLLQDALTEKTKSQVLAQKIPEGLVKEPMVEIGLSVSTWRTLLLGASVLKVFYGDQSLRFAPSKISDTENPVELHPADIQELLAMEIGAALGRLQGRKRPINIEDVIKWAHDAVAQMELPSQEDITMGREPRTAQKEVQQVEAKVNGPRTPSLLPTPTYQKAFRAASFLAQTDQTALRYIDPVQWLMLRELFQEVAHSLIAYTQDHNVQYTLLYEQDPPTTIPEVFDPSLKDSASAKRNSYIENFLAPSKSKTSEEQESIEQIEKRLREGQSGFVTPTQDLSQG